MKAALFLLTLPAIAFAGPTLACHAWVSPPGSAFAAVEPLRDAAMYVANHPEKAAEANQKIAELRSAIRTDDAVSLLRAGYWIAILHSIRMTTDTGGQALIQQALALRPDDPEYHFFAALSAFDTDKAQYQKHWARARALAKAGSAVSRNLAAFEPVLQSRTK
jgi:hypothetical protein